MAEILWENFRNTIAADAISSLAIDYGQYAGPFLQCSGLWPPTPSQHRQMVVNAYVFCISWWCHQMEIFSALQTICAGNSPVPGEFPTQRPVTRSFDVLFDLRPNKRLSKQWWGWWFETPSCPLWRQCNVLNAIKQVNGQCQGRDTLYAQLCLGSVSRYTKAPGDSFEVSAPSELPPYNV